VERHFKDDKNYVSVIEDSSIC